MSIEEYVKQQLASQGISLKDAADVLGYATQSFRNKLARHSLNVHDIFMLSMTDVYKRQHCNISESA